MFSLRLTAGVCLALGWLAAAHAGPMIGRPEEMLVAPDTTNLTELTSVTGAAPRGPLLAPDPTATGMAAIVPVANALSLGTRRLENDMPLPVAADVDESEPIAQIIADVPLLPLMLTGTTAGPPASAVALIEETTAPDAENSARTTPVRAPQPPGAAPALPTWVGVTAVIFTLVLVLLVAARARG